MPFAGTESFPHLSIMLAKRKGFFRFISPTRQESHVNNGAAIMIFVYASLIVLATCSNALAYTDPGSGLLIWQMLCAALVGVMFQYNKIITFIKSKFKKHD